MTSSRFWEIGYARIEKIRDLLARKKHEYASDEDCLRNFRNAAKIDGKTMAEVCKGYMLKHWTSIADIIEGRASKDLADEKIGDAIAYLILLDAILQEE
jgi:hypothetical protein